MPSLGYKTYRLLKGRDKVSYPNPFSISRSKEGLKLSNELFSIEIDPDTGCLRSIFDKKNGREVLDISGRGNLLVAIEDEGDSEGRFVVESDTTPKPPGKAWEIISEPSIEVSESGPVRAKVRIKKSFRNSIFTQDIILYSKIERVDFGLTVEWHDIHWMIKVAFPLNVEDAKITYDTPYGSVIRPADGHEYSAQKWVDLSSSEYGVALLNNSRYGHDVEGNTVRMSILRSPTTPAYNTDEGVHGYSIYPHSGTWREAGVIRRGYEFNYPLITIVEDNHEGNLPPASSLQTS